MTDRAADHAHAVLRRILACRWAPDGPYPSRAGLSAVRTDADDLHAFCVDLLRSLEITPPFTPARLCRRLGEVRGRRVALQAADLGATTSIGHLVAMPHEDRVLYERTAPRAQQSLVVLHEVMHLVRGHLADAETLTCGALLGPEAGDTGRANLYSERHEWEAETGATVLHRLSGRRLRPDQYVVRDDAWSAETGVAGAFGLAGPDWMSR